MKLFDTFYMNKRILIILFTSLYLLGISAVLVNYVILFSCVIFLLLTFLTFKKFIFEKDAIVLFSIFAFGILNCSLRLNNTDFLASFAPQNDISVTGRISSLPSSSSDNYTKFIVNVEKFNLPNKPEVITNSRTIVTLFAPKSVYKNIETGDLISLKGRLTKPKYSKNSLMLLI